MQGHWIALQIGRYFAGELDNEKPFEIVSIFLYIFPLIKIINVKDPNWWQAKNITAESEKIGLIPSQELEERRKAFVAPEADYVHKIGICGTRVSFFIMSLNNFKLNIIFSKRSRNESARPCTDRWPTVSSIRRNCCFMRRSPGCLPSAGKPWSSLEFLEWEGAR